jgi:hypothetical protein
MPVTEPRYDLDDWLARDVQPLAPPPGTFERIRHRARRRKLNQALLAGAGAVLVLAGGVLIPAAATGVLSGPAAPRPAAAGSPTRPAGPSSAPATSAPASQSPNPEPGAGGSALSATTSGDPVPAGFQPVSITMISGSIGAVIGQAGTPGHCGPPVADDCTSLAGTSDDGASWYGVSAPVTGPPDGATGVGQLRFLNLSDGWAFGPQLYATADGGRTWTAVSTGDGRVTGLEAAGDRAFVVVGFCQGQDAAAFESDCRGYTLYSIVAGSTTLVPVPVTAPGGALGLGDQQNVTPTLAIAGDPGNPDGGTGYLLGPTGDILRGSVGGGAWTYVGKAPCSPNLASTDGVPSAQLAAGPGSLLLNCEGAGSGLFKSTNGTQVKELWASATGATWTRVSAPPTAGGANSLARSGTGAVLLATSAGLFYAPADTGPWAAAAVTGGVPAAGFSYVGMTSDTNGVALPVNAALGEVFITQDGGRTWVPHRVSA